MRNGKIKLCLGRGRGKGDTRETWKVFKAAAIYRVSEKMERTLNILLLFFYEIFWLTSL